jgi:hypothetical protein
MVVNDDEKKARYLGLVVLSLLKAENAHRFEDVRLPQRAPVRRARRLLLLLPLLFARAQPPVPVSAGVPVSIAVVREILKKKKAELASTDGVFEAPAQKQESRKIAREARHVPLAHLARPDRGNFRAAATH